MRLWLRRTKVERYVTTLAENAVDPTVKHLMAFPVSDHGTRSAAYSVCQRPTEVAQTPG